MTIASQSGTIEVVSTQIAVRLPDHLVVFLDELVTDGKARSRAHAVTKALMKYERRIRGEQDAGILREHGGYPEFDAWIARRHIPPVD